MTADTTEPSDANRNSSFVVFAPFFPPAVNGGGPIRSLAALVSTSPLPGRVATLTSDRDLGASVHLPITSNAWTSWNGHRLYYGSVDRPRELMRLMLAATRLNYNVYYLNSFFDWRFSLVPQLVASMRRDRPAILLAPRGEMGAGALSRRSLKKQVLIALYKLVGQHKRVTFHATGPDEARDIRGTFGSHVKIVTRTNQTLLPQKAVQTPDPPRVRLIFAGRVVPHKGLLTVLEALRDITPRILLTVIGPEEDEGYARQCRAVAGELEHDVQFEGSMPHETILAEMSESTCLVLPTAGENFGHVLAEALSMSCPVLVSDSTPWSETIASHGAGQVLADSQDVLEWRAAIQGLIGSSVLERDATRAGAAACYNEWQQSQGQHLFDIYDQETAPG